MWQEGQSRADGRGGLQKTRTSWGGALRDVEQTGDAIRLSVRKDLSSTGASMASRRGWARKPGEQMVWTSHIGKC